MRSFPSFLLIFTLSYFLYLEGTSGLEDLTLSVDGLRCNSCGKECSTVCGSRQFKSCCLNFIKRKRSYPKIRAVFRRTSSSTTNNEKESIGKYNWRKFHEGLEILPNISSSVCSTYPFGCGKLSFKEITEIEDKSRISIADEPETITIDQHFVLPKIPPEDLENSYEFKHPTEN